MGKRILSILLTTITVISVCTIAGCSKDTESQMTYEISGLFDSNAIDTYPQVVVDINGDTCTLICSNYAQIDEIPVTIEDTAMYLSPSDMIQSDNEAIDNISKELFSDTNTDIERIEKALNYTSQTIEFDKELAQEISQGSYGRDALSTLEIGKGTCSEYANVFIALMRNQGIPSRMAVGKIYKKSYHAWAEVYIDSRWVPVDPQMGKLGITNMHIKLFEGMDYYDIGIPLMDINLHEKRVK